MMIEDCLDDRVGMESPNDTSEEGLCCELVEEDGHLAGEGGDGHLAGGGGDGHLAGGGGDGHLPGGGGQGGGLVDSIWQFVVQSVLVELSNPGEAKSGNSNQSNRKGEEGKSSTVSGASLNKVLS
jgi:hypothetical protein